MKLLRNLKESSILNNENYYSTTELGSNILLSNTALSRLNPNEGGSEKKFINFIKREETITTSSMDLGILVHKYMEKGQKEFLSLLIEKPTQKMGLIADEILLTIKENRVKLEEISDEYLLEIAKNFNYGSNWKPDTIVNKIIDSAFPYIQQLEEAEEKNLIPISKPQLEKVISCTEAIKENVLYNKIVSEASERVEVENEVVITGIINNAFFKGMLDKVIIKYHDNKVIVKIIDFKTTSYPVGTYITKVTPFVESGVELYNEVPGHFYISRINRQQLIYKQLILEYLKNELPENADITIENYIVVVETVEPHDVLVYKVTDLDMHVVTAELKILIDNAGRIIEERLQEYG